MNRGLGTLACILIILGVQRPALAEDKLAVTFEFGYNGVVPKSMRFAPVRVRIRNHLRNLAGRIEISQPCYTGHEVSLVKTIRSPSPSTQVFTLYPRIESSGGADGFSLEARVVFDDKSLGTFKETVHGKSNKRIVLTCGTSKFFQRNLDLRDRKTKPLRMRILATTNYQFVPMTPLGLPDTVFGYDSVHAVILNGAQFVRLSNRQTAAIAEWMRGGGRVLIYHPVKSPPLERWLKPMGIEDVTRFSMTRIGIGLLAIQPYRTGRDLPFWLRKGRELDASSFFPELVFDSSEGLMSGTREPRDSGGFQLLVQRGDGSTYGTRGFVWLLLIILVYLAFIGPVDWWITKKTGKHWLSWPIFAAVIIGFSIISYWYSGMVQSAPMSLVWTSVLDVGPDGGENRGEGCFWLHSTGNFDFDIEAEKLGSMLSCRESSSSDQSAAAGVTVENRSNKPSTIACRIPVFSSKEFNFGWREPAKTTPKQVNGSYELPQDVTPRKVLLATRRGVRRCEQMEDGLWGPSDSNRKWWEVYRKFKSNLTELDFNFPTQDVMDEYLLAVCFSGLMGNPQDINDMASPWLNEWEVSLDQSEYLRSGHSILIVFVDKQLNEISISKGIPRRIGVDCIRYFIPRKTRDPVETE